MARLHQNNFSTNVTTDQIAGVTTTPINAIPSIAAPFYIALDATNLNSRYEVVDVTSKTATHINHAATTYAHTTDEEVRMVVPAVELDAFSAKTDAGDDGWVAYSTVTPTYTSADDPTYTITFASVDLTSTMSVGTRVKFTNNSTTFYGIITVIAFSTNTVVTLYGGTDYDVANSAITAFYYSRVKAPHGFPLNPTKWTVETTNTGLLSQSSPANGTWYNVGTLSLVIPIGVWDVSYKVSARADATAGSTQVLTALSTTNNGASNDDFTIHTMGASATIAEGGFFARSILTLAAKTTYYLNGSSTGTSVSALYFMGTSAKIVIRAVCSYL